MCKSQRWDHTISPGSSQPEQGKLIKREESKEATPGWVDIGVLFLAWTVTGHVTVHNSLQFSEAT